MARHLYGRISGPANAPPMVLLPGARGNSLMWMSNIETLSATFRTYAVDSIFDYGRSVSMRDLSSLDDYVLWLDELFVALDVRGKINLVGMSYGGWLTSQYALRFQDRLDKIVLLAPACTVLPLQCGFVMRAMFMSLSRRCFTRSFIFWIFADMAKKGEASRKRLKTIADGMFDSSRSFMPKPLIRPTVLTDNELQSVTVPSLFMVGENEKIYSARKAVQRLNKAAPHIKTEIIPNAGHDLTFVQAELVNRKILEFMKQPSGYGDL